jgi:hypothetical protein
VTAAIMKRPMAILPVRGQQPFVAGAYAGAGVDIMMLLTPPSGCARRHPPSEIHCILDLCFKVRQPLCSTELFQIFS